MTLVFDIHSKNMLVMATQVSHSPRPRRRGIAAFLNAVGLPAAASAASGPHAGLEVAEPAALGSAGQEGGAEARDLSPPTEAAAAAATTGTSASC